MAKAQELENFGHQHPLVLLSDELNNQSKEPIHSCARCGEVASLSSSVPCLGCVECGFYLHKKCADAPLEINHPFHRSHPLVLLQNSPYPENFSVVCTFCDQTCEFFVYHCSCELDFHIKCALFTYDIAEKNLKELQQDVANHEEPFHLKENEGEKDKIKKCFGCWEPLFDSAYLTLDSGLLLHKSCAELPFKINLMCHRKHPFFLQFNSESLSCNVCKITQHRGFIYCCLRCKFAVHIQCASPSPVLEDESHPHPFTLLWRQTPFICDACGTEGICGYICSTCNIIVHKKCISLPRFIKSRWHHHYLAHTYFIEDENYFISWDCMICHDEVNIEYGSYYCSGCKKIAHVNCATKEENWYYIVSPENEDEKSLLDDIDPITVIERNNAGEAVKIKHFKHTHDMVLNAKIVEYERCDGCMLPISDSFYYCLKCDFFLYKDCAKLPKKKQFWLHEWQKPLILTSYYIFRCKLCDYLSHGFAYKCNKCEGNTCLRCINLSPDGLTCEGHEHPLLFYLNYEGECRACGCACGKSKGEVAYYCKGCDFALGSKCILLPNKAQHKCDKNLLKLTYRENNDYSESHYCDICEESRDPNYGFYHCATCDTSAHIDCILGKYSFTKQGSIYNVENHPHPLTFVKKIYYYPNCFDCGEPCQDLALECSTSGCNYIVHWKCVAPRGLSM